MTHNTSDPIAHDSSAPDSATPHSHLPEGTDTPTTATGERSRTIENDERGGILPTPTPADDGAPAA
ncbi:MAG: hypothetical protein ABWX65_03700 [Mycetocola sp.]